MSEGFPEPRLLFYEIDAIPDIKTEHFVLDFELAPLNAIKKVFPDRKYSGCYFHLRQSFHRKLMDLKLGPMYSKLIFRLLLKITV